MSEFGLMSDDEIIAYLEDLGYEHIRKLEDGEWVLIMPLLFTVSVCCGVGKTTSYKYRWCFKDPKEARYFFKNCKTYDEIPTKRSSLKGHRYFDEPRLIEYDKNGFPLW